MVKVLYPIKDATIYEKYPDQNTGLDQILEINKQITGSDKYNSRALVQFDLDNLPSDVQFNGSVSGAEFRLQLDVTETEELPLKYKLNVHPIDMDWDMGIGKKQDNPKTEVGVSWNTVDGNTSWNDPGGDFTKNPTSIYTVTQSFDFESANVDMNVSSIVREIQSGSIDNNGFIIKRPTGSESDLNEYGSIKFFSRDSHTIYPPRLMVIWDDSSYNTEITGSKQIISDFDIKVKTRFTKDIYYDEEQPKFRLTVQPKIQPKTFYEDFKKKDELYLPSSSYYAVKDEFSGNTVIPYSDGTKVSADPTSSYFNFDMNNLQPDRFYRFVYKIEDNGLTHVVDDRINTFRVGT